MIDEKRGVMIFDMDDVLFNIAPKIYKGLRKNFSIIGNLIKDLGPKTDKEIYDRKSYSVKEWISLDDLSEKEISIINEIEKGIFKDENFYDDIEPTELCKKTVMNIAFIENPMVKKIIILTKYPSEELKIAKIKKLKECLPKSEKIEIIYVPKGESKFDALRGEEWDLLVDDDISNIDDFASKTKNLEKKEFLIPNYGYNKMPGELSFRIQAKYGIISYYDVF